VGKEYDDLSPEDKEATRQGGENEASSYPDMPDDMGPEPEPKAKPKSPDRPYKKVSPDRPYKKMAAGGKVGGRGDGCCTKGKTKGRFV
jgi:hypothetical protein